MTAVAKNHVMSTTPDQAPLRALDPDLPILAARAAMQLDSAISVVRSGKFRSLRTDAIDQLAKLLSNMSSAIAGESGDLASRSLMDPLTANIVSRAYSDASKANLTSLGQLKSAAEKLSEMLKKASSQQQGNDPVAALVLLRDFCVNLSEYAASKRQLAYGERPTNAHWRLR